MLEMQRGQSMMERRQSLIEAHLLASCIHHQLIPISKKNRTNRFLFGDVALLSLYRGMCCDRLLNRYWY